MCLYDNEKRSYIRLYDMPSIMKGEEPKMLLQIDASKDYLLTNAVWGPKNETLIVATNIGKILVYNLEHGQLIEEKAVHAGDIYSLTITNDYTMLVSAGKDGSAKLLHPETL
jgi:WD40 repeat protein